jgi:hypothetical protein
MSLIIPANSAAAAGGYAVDNSCRFNDGSSDNLSRTTETPTNAKKYTFSVWVKRSNLGAANMKIFGVQGANANEQNLLEFNADDLVWQQSDSSGGNTVYRLKTDRKFRDIAWYHIVVAYDSSQGTADNRIRMYINGVEETSFSTRTNPSANLDSLINSSVSATAGRTLRLGRTGDNGSQYFDGYMSEVCFIDGLQLAPTSFGEFDEDSGIWKPIDGLADDLTFGNNGFYLDFEDSAALGADVSGNTNNFTVNNLTAIDQTTDTPTNNFATFNSLTEFSGNGMAEGNLKFTNSTSTYSMRHSTFALTKGKWYAEFKITQMSGGFTIVGIQDTSQFNYDSFLTSASRGYGYRKDGTKGNNNSASSFGNTFDTGDIIGVAMDLDNNKLYFSKNGTFQNSGDPTSGATGTGSAFDIADGYDYCIGASSNDEGTDQVIEANFGNPSFAISSSNTDGNDRGNFEYAVPSGYYSLNTKNLAEYG